MYFYVPAKHFESLVSEWFCMNKIINTSLLMLEVGKDY